MRVLVSRKISGTVIGRDIRTMAAEAGIPILAAEIEQRVAFAESVTMGKTIFEWPRRHSRQGDRAFNRGDPEPCPKRRSQQHQSQDSPRLKKSRPSEERGRA